MPYKDKNYKRQKDKERLRVKREDERATTHIWSVVPLPTSQNIPEDEYIHSRKKMTATLLDGTVIPLRRRISLEQQGIPYD